MRGFKPPPRLLTIVCQTDPPGLQRARWLANVLDDAVRLPGGIRVGLDPVFSALPVAGGLVGAVLSAYIVFEAWRAGVPRARLARMSIYVIVEAVLGSIPIVGPLVDAVVRVNRRNVALFEEAINSPASQSRP